MKDAESDSLGNRMEPSPVSPGFPPTRSGVANGLTDQTDRGAVIRQMALDILRRESPVPSVAPASSPVDEGVAPVARIDSGHGDPANPRAGISAPQETIPARMLNEFVYCPRLFYYEFVEGVFVENADTLRGSSLHRRVDSGSGELPPAADQKSAIKGQKSDKEEPKEEAGEAVDGEKRNAEKEDAATIESRKSETESEVIHSRSVQMGSDHLEPPPATLLKLKQSADAALRARSLEELLGIEGRAASAYFEQFSGMIKVADELTEEAKDGGETKAGQTTFNFNFTHRNRRPPTDPVNALLSLSYSMLAKDCVLAVLAVGFDPYVGFYHQPRFGRPAMALDLMEEFRPLVAESTVLNCINNRAITPADFVRAGQAVNLTAGGRKRFFQIYEQRMSSLLTHPIFDYKVSYRRALELQARLLAKTLTGEIPEYVPLLTR
ncbi:MAG: CRISPR-associated endonuclease Cas1 [Candidatus Omnitrophica bacterium]|nr:CRISPR-associated endonuclease Cas1 [Candidatus Omnitrophota bacterium]